MKKVLSLLFVMSLLLTGCGGSDSGTDSDAKSDTTDKTEKKEDVKEYVDESEFAKVYSNPDKYKDKYIKLSGKIFQTPEKDDAGIYFQMWADPENSDLNTVVGIKDTSVSLASDDYVIIDGKITGAFKGTNAYGGSVTALQVVADTAQKSSYQEVVSPTLKEVITDGMVNSQHGVDISVSKVEFAANETRVYYSVTNNSGSKYSFYDFNIKIVQGGKQHETQSNYSADYPSISGDVLSGVSGEGIAAFPAIEQSDFELHFDSGYSDDYNLRFEAFSFPITVQ